LPPVGGADSSTGWAKMMKLAVWLIALVALALVGPGWCRLPDGALKRGKEAEKLVQSGKLPEAIASWEKIDKAYPGMLRSVSGWRSFMTRLVSMDLRCFTIAATWP